MEMFPETSGTAALAGRDLPSAAVLAADQHLTALAQAMKAAGQPGTLDILRAWAYLHLLSGQPADTLIPPASTPATPAMPRPPTAPHARRHPSTSAPGDPGSQPPGGTGPSEAPRGPDAAPASPPPPGTPPPGNPGPWPRPSATPGLRGTVNLTMPLSAWLGWTESPGDVPGYGPVDADDSRTLAGLLAQRPGNQWCVTLTDPAGHPIAHACARHGPPGPPAAPATPGDPAPPPVPGQRASPVTRSPGTPSPPDSHPTPRSPGHQPTTTPPRSPDWLRGLTFATLQTRDCTHPRESRGYQPSPALRHLIHIRNPTCTGPGCRRPATRCDLDHATPYDRGGRTCECNLGPACRHDHQCKQAPGWTVTTPTPGTYTWTTPGNRTHTTTPAPVLGIAQ